MIEDIRKASIILLCVSLAITFTIYGELILRTWFNFKITNWIYIVFGIFIGSLISWATGREKIIISQSVEEVSVLPNDYDYKQLLQRTMKNYVLNSTEDISEFQKLTKEFNSVRSSLVDGIKVYESLSLNMYSKDWKFHLAAHLRILLSNNRPNKLSLDSTDKENVQFLYNLLTGQITNIKMHEISLGALTTLLKSVHDTSKLKELIERVER